MKRVVAAGVGYALGLASAAYVRKRMRRAVDRVAPEKLRSDLAAKSSDLAAQARTTVERAREVVGDLRDAAAEGLDSMRAADSELQAAFGAAAIGSDDPRSVGPDDPRSETQAPGGHRARR